MKTVVTGIAVLGVLAGVILFTSYISYSNGEIRLRNQVLAQQKANEAVFDNTWQIIQQQAGVAEEYKNAFKEIYPALMSGRYGNARGGALMSWVTEHNPNFDVRLFDRLMSSIEVQRTVFTNEQKKLIDLGREHDTMLQMFPGSLFLSGRQHIGIKIVTSTKTDQAFALGKDDDVNLFQHAAPAAPAATTTAPLPTGKRPSPQISR